MQKDKSLSDTQMEIMRILWDSGEATVADVHRKLGESRELATTTVATMLTRLEKRELITHRTEGRQYFYSSKISEGEIRRSMVKDLVGRVFQGDVKALVNHLVRESEIDADDLEAIQSMIKSREQEEK